jgi:hypothetical protein
VASSAAPPLIHIGYQKTGTSWMQRFLFPAEAEAGFASVSKRNVRRQFIFTHPLDFSAETARELLMPQIDEARRRGGVPVVSTERLSGSPHAGRYDAKDIAERLRAVFAEARILIVVREQRAMIGSVYRQYVRWGGSLPPERYLHPTKQGDIRLPAFEIAAFAYDRLVRLYVDLFGPESVLVLPFEMLTADPVGFVARIAEFAGAPADRERFESLPFERARNVAATHNELALRRLLNRLGADDRVNPTPVVHGPRAADWAQRNAGRLAPFLPRAFGERFERRVEVTIAELVGDRFAGSNAALSELSGFDLARYGYTVAPAGG